MLQKIFSRKTASEDGPSVPDLQREARYYSRLLSDKLEQLDVCYRYRKSEKDLLERGVQRVKFNMAITHPEAIWLRIDTNPRRFPRGVSLAMINDPVILNDLSVVAERPVNYKRSADGAWLVVEREHGVFDIKLIHYNAVDAAYPVKSLKALQVPLGLTFNHKIVYRSLADFPHALVGGATGAGKTTFLHAWICSLAQHHAARDVRFGLLDLKGGVEFTRYQKLPHVLEGGFVKDESDVAPLLEALEGEMKHRLEMFEKRGGIQNIAQWNVRAETSARYDHLYRIVLFVDELSAVMLKPDLRKDAIRLFTTLGERGRAPGIHLVLATQRPIVRVVDGQIKGNLEARFAFRVTDDTSSMVILDSIEAAQFGEDTPRGRYIYKSGLERMELQAALITPMQIKRIINAVLRGDEEGAAEAAKVAPEDIFRAALKIDGDFSIRNLYRALEGKVSRGYIESLAREYQDGETIELDGITYQLRSPSGKFQSRRLVPTDRLKECGYIGGYETENDQDAERGTSGNAIVLASESVAETEQENTGNRRETETWLRWALQSNSGYLTVRKIARRFSIRTEDVTRGLSDCEEQGRVTVDGVPYVVKPSRGNFPRRLVKEVEHGN